MASKHPPHGRGSIPLRCRECGRSRDEVAHMSARALCDDCACRRDAEAQTQQVAGAGPFYEAWRSGVLSFAADLAQS